MTADELRSHFNRVFGIEKEWPKTYEVDAVTYANCCQAVFIKQIDNFPEYRFDNGIEGYVIALGPNKGLMFKNVELILKP